MRDSKGIPELMLLKDKHGHILQKIDIYLPGNIPVFCIRGSVSKSHELIATKYVKGVQIETVATSQTHEKRSEIDKSDGDALENCEAIISDISLPVFQPEKLVDGVLAVDESVIWTISDAIAAMENNPHNDDVILHYVSTVTSGVNIVKECVNKWSTVQSNNKNRANCGFTSMLCDLERLCNTVECQSTKIMDNLNSLEFQSEDTPNLDIQQHINAAKNIINIIEEKLNCTAERECCEEFVKLMISTMYPFFQATRLLNDDEMFGRINNAEKQKYVFQICLDTLALRRVASKKVEHIGSYHRSTTSEGSSNCADCVQCAEAYEDVLEFGEDLIASIGLRCKQFVTILDRNHRNFCGVNGVYDDYLLYLNDYHLPFKLCVMVNNKSVIEYTQRKSFRLIGPLFDRMKDDLLPQNPTFYDTLRTKTMKDSITNELDADFKSNIISLRSAFVDSETLLSGGGGVRESNRYSPLVDVLSDVAQILEAVVGLKLNNDDDARPASCDWSLFNSISQSVCDQNPIVNEETIKFGLVKKLLILSNEIYQNCDPNLGLETMQSPTESEQSEKCNIDPSVTYYKQVYDMFIEFRRKEKQLLQLIADFFSQTNPPSDTMANMQTLRRYCQELECTLSTEIRLAREYHQQRDQLEVFDDLYDTFYSVDNNFDYLSTNCVNYLKICDDLLPLVDQSEKLSTKLDQLLAETVTHVQSLYDMVGDLSTTLDSLGVVVTTTNTNSLPYKYGDMFDSDFVESIETSLQTYRNRVEKLNKKMLNLMDNTVKAVQLSADLVYDFRDSIEPIFPNFVTTINNIHEQLHILSKYKSRLYLALTNHSNSVLGNENKLHHININSAIQHQWKTLGECYQSLLTNECSYKSTMSFPSVIRTQHTIIRAKACYMLCRIEEGGAFVKCCNRIMQNSGTNLKGGDDKYHILISMYDQQLTHLKQLVENRIDELDREEYDLAALFGVDNCPTDLLQHTQNTLWNTDFITVSFDSAIEVSGEEDCLSTSKKAILCKGSSPILTHTQDYEGKVNPNALEAIERYLDSRNRCSVTNPHMKLFHHIYSQRVDSLGEIAFKSTVMGRIGGVLAEKITSLNSELVDFAKLHRTHDKCWNFTTLSSLNVVVDNFTVWQHKLVLLAKLSQTVRLVADHTAQNLIYKMLLGRNNELAAAKKLTLALMSEYFFDLKHVEWVNCYLVDCEYDDQLLDKLLDGEPFEMHSVTLGELAHVVDTLARERALISRHHGQTSIVLNMARTQLETIQSLTKLLSQPQPHSTILPFDTILQSFQSSLEKFVASSSSQLTSIEPHLDMISKLQLIFGNFYRVVEGVLDPNPSRSTDNVDVYLHSIFLLKQIPQRNLFSTVIPILGEYFQDKLAGIASRFENEMEINITSGNPLQTLIQTSVAYKKQVYELFGIWKETEILLVNKLSVTDCDETRAKVEDLLKSTNLLRSFDSSNSSSNITAIQTIANAFSCNSRCGENLDGLKKKIIDTLSKLHDAIKHFTAQNEWLNGYVDELSQYIDALDQQLERASDQLAQSTHLEHLNHHQATLDQLLDEVGCRVKSIDNEIVKIGRSVYSLWYVESARQWCITLVNLKHTLVDSRNLLQQWINELSCKVRFYADVDNRLHKIESLLECNENLVQSLHKHQMSVILDESVSAETIMNVLSRLDHYVNDVDSCRTKVNSLKSDIVHFSEGDISWRAECDDQTATPVQSSTNDKLYLKVCALELQLSNFDNESQCLKKRLLLEATSKDVRSLVEWLELRKREILGRIEQLKQHLSHSITTKVLDGGIRREHEQIGWLAERFLRDVRMILIVCGNMIEELNNNTYNPPQAQQSNNSDNNRNEYMEISPTISKYLEVVQAELQLLNIEYNSRLGESSLFMDNLQIHLDQLDDCLVFGELIDQITNIERLFNDKISLYRQLIVENGSEFLHKYSYFTGQLAKQKQYWSGGLVYTAEVEEDSSFYETLLSKKMTTLKSAIDKFEATHASRNIFNERLKLIECDVEKCNHLNNLVLESCDSFHQLTAYVSQLVDLKCELYQHKLFVFNSNSEFAFGADHRLGNNLENLTIAIDLCEQCITSVLEEFTTGSVCGDTSHTESKDDLSCSLKPSLARVRTMQKKLDRLITNDNGSGGRAAIDSAGGPLVKLIEITPIIAVVRYLMLVTDDSNQRLSTQAELSRLLDTITSLCAKNSGKQCDTTDSANGDCFALNCEWLSVMEAVLGAIEGFVTSRQHSKSKDLYLIYKLIQLIKKLIGRQQKSLEKNFHKSSRFATAVIEGKWLESYRQQQQCSSNDMSDFVEQIYARIEALKGKTITTKIMLKKYIRKQCQLEKCVLELGENLDRTRPVPSINHQTPLSQIQLCGLRKNLEKSKSLHKMFESDLSKSADEINRLLIELTTTKNSFGFSYNNYTLQQKCIETSKRYSHRRAVCSNLVKYLSGEYSVLSGDLELIRKFGDWLKSIEKSLKHYSSFIKSDICSKKDTILKKKFKLNKFWHETMKSKRQFNEALRRLLILPVDNSNPVESFHSMASVMAQRWIAVKKQLREKALSLTAEFLQLTHLEKKSTVNKTNWKSRLTQSRPPSATTVTAKSTAYGGAFNWPKQNPTNSKNSSSRRYQLLNRGAFVSFLLKNDFNLTIDEALSIFDHLSNNKRYVKCEDFLAVVTPRNSTQNSPPKVDDNSASVTEYIDNQLIDVLFKCTCDVPLQIKRVEGNKLVVGKKGKTYMIRVVKSTVMVRVGGGWENLGDFIAKFDPCQVAGHKNRLSANENPAQSVKYSYQLPFLCELEINSRQRIRNRFLSTPTTFTKTLLPPAGEALSVPKLSAIPSQFDASQISNDDSSIMEEDSLSFTNSKN